MQAFELMGKVDEKGQLLLDKPLKINPSSRVKVILLVSDETESNPDEIDPDDTTIEEVKASLKRALQDWKEEKTIPLEKMWEGIDAE